MVFANTAAVIIFWISFCAWIALAVWLTARERKFDQSADSVKVEDWGSGKILVITVIVLLILFFVLPGSVSGANIHWHRTALFVLGIFFVWCGIALRFFAIRTLGKFFKTVVAVRNEQALVVAGPYRFLRHPGYAGAWLTLIGLGLALGNWIGVAVAIVLPLPGYLWRIHVEEATLRRKFGDEYESYIKRTRAIIPFIW